MRIQNDKLSGRSAISLVLAFVFLSGCTPRPTMLVATQTNRPEPTLASIYTEIAGSSLSDEDLVQLLEFSDPTSSSYDPDSAEYRAFPEILKKLTATNAETNGNAPMLAYALYFPREDSVLAAQDLLTLGPDWIGIDISALVGQLKGARADVRVYTAILLSETGEKGSCTLGSVGPLLRDADPYVRTSAAIAIQGITGKKLTDATYTIIPGDFTTKPVAADVPEGKFVNAARKWWDETGSKVNWHPSYDICDP